MGEEAADRGGTGDLGFCLSAFSKSALKTFNFHFFGLTACLKAEQIYSSQIVIMLRSQVLASYEITRTNEVNLDGFCTDTFFVNN